MTLTHADVEEILRLLDSAGAELLVEEGSFRLEVRRSGEGLQASRPGFSQVVDDRQAKPDASSPESISTGAPAPSHASTGDIEIEAPMTGTFFRASAPQEPPFVEEGDFVEAGTPLCLIEVMKLFTTVEAPRAGTVVRILAENAAVVQTGEPLFAIRPEDTPPTR